MIVEGKGISFWTRVQPPSGPFPHRVGGRNKTSDKKRTGLCKKGECCCTLLFFAMLCFAIPSFSARLAGGITHQSLYDLERDEVYYPPFALHFMA